MTTHISVCIEWDPAAVDRLRVTDAHGTGYVTASAADLRWLVRLSRRTFRRAAERQDKEFHARLVLLAQAIAALDAVSHVARMRGTSQHDRQALPFIRPQHEDADDLPF